MRILALATLCALAVLPAQAQQVDRIKATGANAAGACAGSLEMVGQYLNAAQNPDPDRIIAVQQARDFFADLPLYPTSEIAAAANAFIALMIDRLDKAATVAERQEIEREILRVSLGCRESAKAEIVAQRNRLDRQPPLATPSAPVPEPYVVEPSTVQPYTVQPLPLDPALPAQ